MSVAVSDWRSGKRRERHLHQPQKHHQSSGRVYGIGRISKLGERSSLLKIDKTSLRDTPSGRQCIMIHWLFEYARYRVCVSFKASCVTLFDVVWCGVVSLNAPISSLLCDSARGVRTNRMSLHTSVVFFHVYVYDEESLEHTLGNPRMKN